MVTQFFRGRAARWAAALALSLPFGVSAYAASSTVVISELQLGDETSSSAKFLELHNLTGQPIDLTNWTIKKRSASGSEGAFATLSGTLPANCYYLLVSTTYSTKHPSQAYDNSAPVPDSNWPSGSSNNGGSIAVFDSLGNQVDALAVKNGTATLTNPYVEGNPAVFTRGSGTTYQTGVERLPHGVNSQDTDDNSADFVSLYGGSGQVYTASPTASTTCGAPTPPKVESVTFSPASVDPGNNVTLSATVTPGANPVSSVTADLTSIGGGDAVALAQGTGTTWTTTYTVPSATPAGDKSIPVTATDTNAMTGAATGTLTVNFTGGALTVKEAKQQPVGTKLAVRGIVTDISSGNAYIQDPDSVPGGTGLLIFDGKSLNGVEPLKLGQNVTLTGTLDVYNNEFEFVVPAYTTDPTAYTINSENNPLPAVKDVTVEQVTGNDTYEGDLIRIPNLTVVKAPGTIASGRDSTYMVVQDSTGNQIEVYLHRNATAGATTPYPGAPANPIPASVAADTSVTFPDIKVGDIYTVTGPLGEQTFVPNKLIRPRDAADLVLVGRNLITATAATPNLAERGSLVTLSVTTDPATGSTVTVDLSQLGGSATFPLAFDGTSYSGTYTVPSNAPLGPINIPVTASNPANAGGQPSKGQVSFDITTPAQTMTIAQARQAPDWTQVTLTGEVTANTVGTGAIYFQDATGGVYMFATGAGFSANEGDTVTVQGVKTTYNGSVEIDYTDTYVPGSNPSVTGGYPTIQPKGVTMAQWPTVPGQLAKSNSLHVLATVSAGANNYGFIVTDGTATGEIFIHSLAGFGPTDLPVVGSDYTVTGIVDYLKSGSRDTWQIKPRYPTDVTPGTAPAQIPAKLAFATQPGGADVNAALSPQPVVTVQTDAGQTDTLYSGPVTLSIKSGTGASGAKLSGTTTVQAEYGVATFSNVSIDAAGTGYVLTATVYGLTGADSNAFNVGAPAVPGDVDKSGSVTLEDVRLALQIAGGLKSATDPSLSFQNADVTGDQKVTVADAVAIRKLIP